MVKLMRLLSLVLLCALLWSVGPRSAGALGPIEGRELPPTDLERVKVGTLAPDFVLEDENGEAITLSQFRGQKNVVLVFYRGHW